VQTAYGSYTECDFVLPETTPTSGEMQQFLFAKVGGELNSAVAQLNKIGAAFLNKQWADPADGSVTEFDYGDVLILKGAAQAILAELNIQQAYDLDVDIYAEDQKSAAADRTIEAFLSDNPSLGRLKDQSKLAAARTLLAGSIDLFLEGLSFIEVEADSQLDDFIQLDAMEIAGTKADLQEAKGILAAGQIEVQEGTISFNAFFNGIDLRNQLPSFAGDQPGFFPDATVGGLLSPSFNINRDLDQDGRPDLLADYTRFHADLLTQPLYGWAWSPVVTINYNLVLSPEGNFSMSWNLWNSGNWTSGSEAGTWSISDGNLLLTNTNSSSILFSSMLVEMEDGNGNVGDLDLEALWTMRNLVGADTSSGGLHLYN
jgi:hypothetical protein